MRQSVAEEVVSLNPTDVVSLPWGMGTPDSLVAVYVSTYLVGGT